MSTIVLLPISFMILLAGALLFTNAIEWLGAKLELAQGAVGSLLAAVATALPESLIPITAIVRGGEGSDDVAIGAILGAPFMLATVAMALVGLSAIVWRRRRPQGVGLDVHFPTLERDLTFFLVCFGVAFGLGVVGLPLWLRIVAADEESEQLTLAVAEQRGLPGRVQPKRDARARGRRLRAGSSYAAAPSGTKIPRPRNRPASRSAIASLIASRG